MFVKMYLLSNENLRVIIKEHMAKIELAQFKSEFNDEELKNAVLTRLREGDSPFSVAAWMQQDLLLYTDYNTNQLSSVVKEFYIAYVPLSERMGIVKNRSRTQRAAEKRRKQTSALEELEFLYLVQKGRIELFHDAELEALEERRAKQNENEFNNEVNDMIDELEGKKAKPTKKKKEPESPGILLGVGANEIEIARRLLMDIHKTRQELNLQPRQGVAEVINEDSSADELKAKRAKAVKDGLRKLAEQNKQEEDEMTVEAEYVFR